MMLCPVEITVKPSYVRELFEEYLDAFGDEHSLSGKEINKVTRLIEIILEKQIKNALNEAAYEVISGYTP